VLIVVGLLASLRGGGVPQQPRSKIRNPVVGLHRTGYD